MKEEWTSDKALRNFFTADFLFSFTPFSHGCKQFCLNRFKSWRLKLKKEKCDTLLVVMVWRRCDRRRTRDSTLMTTITLLHCVCQERFLICPLRFLLCYIWVDFFLFWFLKTTLKDKTRRGGRCHLAGGLALSVQHDNVVRNWKQLLMAALTL